MAGHYPNHDWRADDFSMIRGQYQASISRAWCAADSCSDPWRWRVWRLDDDGKPTPVDDGIKSYGNTFAEAIAAAEAFVDERIAEEKLGNVYAFEGAPLPAEETF